MYSTSSWVSAYLEPELEVIPWATHTDEGGMTAASLLASSQLAATDVPPASVSNPQILHANSAPAAPNIPEPTLPQLSRQTTSQPTGQFDALPPKGGKIFGKRTHLPARSSPLARTAKAHSDSVLGLHTSTSLAATDVVTDVVDVGIAGAVSPATPVVLSIQELPTVVQIDPVSPTPPPSQPSDLNDGAVELEDDELVSSLLKSLIPPAPPEPVPVATDSGQSTTEHAGLVGAHEASSHSSLPAVEAETAQRSASGNCPPVDPEVKLKRRPPPAKPPAPPVSSVFSWDNPNYRIYADLMKM